MISTGDYQAGDSSLPPFLVMSNTMNSLQTSGNFSFDGGGYTRVYTLAFSLNGSTLTYYAPTSLNSYQGTAGNQLNTSGTVYHYIAIGWNRSILNLKFLL